MAAITDYATLKTEVAAWLHRTDLTAAIPGLIQFAEGRIYRDLRLACMEAALSSTMSSGAIAVPTGYIELKNAYIAGNASQPLLRRDAEWIYGNYPTRSASGVPKYIGREASNFIFGPYPDSDYTVNGIYYKRLDALSASNTGNWFITNAPELLLFATLCEAEPYLVNDPRLVVWERKYAQIKDALQRQEDNEAFSGSILSSSPR
jgi:hypothetical protein